MCLLPEVQQTGENRQAANVYVQPGNSQLLLMTTHQAESVNQWRVGWYVGARLVGKAGAGSCSSVTHQHQVPAHDAMHNQMQLREEHCFQACQTRGAVCDQNTVVVVAVGVAVAVALAVAVGAMLRCSAAG